MKLPMNRQHHVPYFCRTFATFALLAGLALANQTRAEEPTTGFQEPVDVAFTATHDQSEQRYILLLPENYQPGDERDLMIALHGHGSDRWQFIKNKRDECKGARDVAGEYGMLYLSPDYRAKTSWMGPAAETDLVQIIQAMKAAHAIRYVILLGGSMGGTSALTFTALHPELVDGVVSLNGTANHLEYENFQEAIAASFGGTKQEVSEEYYRRSAEYWPLKFTMPVALTTSGKDTAVPPDSVIRLAGILTRLNPNVLHLHRPEADHATNYKDTVAAARFVISRLRAVP